MYILLMNVQKWMKELQIDPLSFTHKHVCVISTKISTGTVSLKITNLKKMVTGGVIVRTASAVGGAQPFNRGLRKKGD